MVYFLCIYHMVQLVGFSGGGRLEYCCVIYNDPIEIAEIFLKKGNQ